ncbi:pseudouridine synthase [Nocardia vermiculata]|uniref:Pseudouridine synthase n=1 Tax=Nocardia vermiculata TaxID=257274 RepID=A0A846YA88_9NOCA|nr:pseudouridine synthase [Nocardia vermiculata]NKY54128.1 pseudouridine synthase [Nocardia vermiculata]
MNTPARRDGTPDRRKRHSDPPRGGRGGTTGRPARGDDRRGGYNDDRRGAYGDNRRGPAGGERRGGYGDDRRSGGRGDDRRGGYGAPRGGSRSGRSEERYGRRDEGFGARSSRPARGDDRPSRQSEGTGRGGDSGYGRGPRAAGRDERGSRGADGYGRGSRPAHGDERGGRTEGGRGGDRFTRGQASSGSRTGADSRPGRGEGRPGRSTTPKPKKRKTPPTVLSFAKPARHQNVETATESGPKKLPWGEGERLQKVLARAGVASRRAAEELIEQGRVEVDGVIVREQGLRIDAETAVVRVDGVRVVVRDEQVYLALNKPKGFQSTMSDEMNRPCVGDIVAERVMAGQRLFHVGRLDAETEGLLLLTNDGDLAHRLMHPSYQVSKTYLATVHGEVQRDAGKQLREGVELEDGPAKVDKFQVLEVGEGKSLVKVILHEGRKHIVRRLLAEVGHPVIGLVRTHVGPVALGDQRPGTLRVLGRDEIGKLYEAVAL